MGKVKCSHCEHGPGPLGCKTKVPCHAPHWRQFQKKSWVDQALDRPEVAKSAFNEACKEVSALSGEIAALGSTREQLDKQIAGLRGDLQHSQERIEALSDALAHADAQAVERCAMLFADQARRNRTDMVLALATEDYDSAANYERLAETSEACAKYIRARGSLCLLSFKPEPAPEPAIEWLDATCPNGWGVVLSAGLWLAYDVKAVVNTELDDGRATIHTSTSHVHGEPQKTPRLARESLARCLGWLACGDSKPKEEDHG